MTASLKLEELASRAGVSPRTVRYYIQRGLLAAPEFRGPDTSYGEHHLIGLRAIRALQEAYWPLDAIAVALREKPLPELRRIADGHLPAGVAAGKGEVGEAAASGRRALQVGREQSAQALRARREQGLSGVRFVLAPGLELWLDESASGEVRALAKDILERAAERPLGKGKE